MGFINTNTITGWEAVQRKIKTEYDLENSPLQIRTDSVIGSDERVSLQLLTSQEKYAGGINIRFSSPPIYWLGYCLHQTNFPSDLPSETDKVWQITFSRSSGAIRVTILCNDKEIVNMVLSDTTCTRSEWSTKWDINKTVAIILFQEIDTASDYYRSGK